jgi:Zn2+/Cd2+-exporting ATPase
MATVAVSQRKPSAGEEARALRMAGALTALTGVSLIAGVILSYLEAPAWTLWLAFGLAYAAGGLPAAKEALESLVEGILDIDLLMVLAALAAAAVGEARDGAILLFLFSLAGTLEDYAMGRTKRAVESLMELRPDTAERRVDGELETVAVESLALGDIVMVRPGARVPADGEIAHGYSAVDESPLTGESVPVDKEPGDVVLAGTVNGYGALEVRVTKRAAETTLARMIELVTQAQAERSTGQRFSDWFGQRYTVFVLLGTLVALGVFFLLEMPSGEAFYKAATLLVVASPCAVVISVPAAVLSGLAAAARGGVLFKGGAALEGFAKANILALDKTGTLTEGKPQVTDLYAPAGSQEELLRLAASLESQSEHPIAESIVSEARARGLELDEAGQAQAVPGRGLVAEILGRRFWAGNRRMAEREGATLSPGDEAKLRRFEAEGKTCVLVGSRDIIGIIALADRVRPQAKAALEALQGAGFKRFVMMTGDHDAAALRVAKALGIQHVHAGLLPEAKVALVKGLRREGTVAFLGDGINDAAALSSADVGVAMGGAGSDVALESADVVLLADDLSKLERAYRLSKRTNGIVRQNLAFAVGVMVVLVLFTLFGNLPLPLGVIGHEGGTLVVVANGLRLLR